MSENLVCFCNSLTKDFNLSMISLLVCFCNDIKSLYMKTDFPGVEFGARMITIDGKQIKLQIWDTAGSLSIFIAK